MTIVTVRALRSGQGRVTLYVRIPKEIALRVGIRPGDALSMELTSTGIVLRKLSEVARHEGRN